jgi:hypothetical protein
MKKYSLIASLFLLIGCTGQKFPEKMPDDFEVEYHLDGGMANMNRTIVLQKGESTDKGRPDDGEDYNYKITITNPDDLQKLYSDLRKLNAFTLKSRDGGQIADRGGESVRYTINGKTYNVSDSQSKFIEKKDAEAFTSSILLILNFAEMHREPAVVNQEEKKDSLSNSKDEPDMGMDQPSMGSGNQDAVMSDEVMLINKDIPTKMPEDFKIKYETGGGISGAYRIINLQYGSSNDENKPAGGTKTNKTWINKNIKNFEALYADLYKLNAFTLKYSTKGNVADRDGEKLSFTINKKEYVVSDKGSDFINSSDKTVFKKAITLILAYVEDSK